MYRIRFHGRGGQGLKTASRILGTAFFLEGFEVQDAPRYGAERRGAPIFAFVRASHKSINERGIIRHPDLVVVADDTLIPVPAAGVLPGIRPRTVLLINSHESPEAWRRRLNITNPIHILPITEEITDRAELPYMSARCVGAAARLLGVISREQLAQAIHEELAPLGPGVVENNLHHTLATFDGMIDLSGLVTEGEEVTAEHYEIPDLIDLPFEDARISAPAIHAEATSVEVKTGLWRTMRPVIDYERCNRCWWVCSSFCPDGAISVDADGRPHIDYEHCKGCMICAAQCPPHAIETVLEKIAQEKGHETQDQS